MIVKKYWDFFYKEGEKRTIMGYTFSVNTGNANQSSARSRNTEHNNPILLFNKYKPYSTMYGYKNLEDPGVSALT